MSASSPAAFWTIVLGEVISAKALYVFTWISAVVVKSFMLKVSYVRNFVICVSVLSMSISATW